MKKQKFALSLICVIIMCMMHQTVVSASSQDYFDDSYCYTVRIYAGGQGVFADGSHEMIIKATAGTVIDLSQTLDGIKLNPGQDAMGNPTDNKYYAKGIRESGKDNNTISGNLGSVFRIDEDKDYVVAYAMKGGDVAYTVRYLEKDINKELYPAETFYGNVGEKPVVAYQYLAGYFPQAYNLTKTLHEDPAENIFTFYYQMGDGGRYEYVETDGGTIIRYVDGNTVVDYIPGTTVYVEGGGGAVTVITENGGRNRGNNGNGNGGNGDNGGQTADGDAANAQSAEDQGANVTIDDEATPQDAGPAQLIDIDDEATPLDYGSGLEFAYQESNSESSKLVTTLVMIAVISGLILSTGVVLIVRRKKMLQRSVHEIDVDVDLESLEDKDDLL